MTRTLSSRLLRGSRRPSLSGVTLLGAAAVLSAAVATAGPSATAAIAATPASFAVTNVHTITTTSFTTINDPADPTFNQLLGINDNGRIAGYFGNGTTNPNRGYTVTRKSGQNTFTNENFPGSVQTQVVGINNNGVTVGFWIDGANHNFGFTDVHGTFTKVSNPAGSAFFDQLLGVNDHNVAVGFYTDAAGKSHGYTYSLGSGKFRPVLLPVQADSVVATGINNRGDISGFYTVGTVTSGFLLSQGHFRSLSFGAGRNTQALGVNNADEVVGSLVNDDGSTQGFVWVNGNVTTIVAPNGVKGTSAMTVINGLNNRGQLVGFYLDANGNTDGVRVSTSS